jgi:heat shock protein HslJ
MKSIFSIATVCTMSIAISSCDHSKKIATEPAAGSGALYQSEWKLTEVQGEMVPPGSKAMLAFTAAQPNKVSGSTGCNRMSGTFELSGAHTIAFSPLATTKMACLDSNANALEQKFTNALMQTNGWGIDDNMLLLKNGEATVAKLKAQKPATAEELKLNGAWELNYISGARIAFDGLFPNKKPTIIFDFPKEEAYGNGSCNGYSVKVKVEGNTVHFGDALSTMMACEGNGEPVYFTTLKTATSYNVHEDTLTMIMGDIAVMRFTRK